MVYQNGAFFGDTIAVSISYQRYLIGPALGLGAALAGRALLDPGYDRVLWASNRIGVRTLRFHDQDVAVRQRQHITRMVQVSG